MFDTRRRFLGVLASALASLAPLGRTLAAQGGRTSTPQNPEPSDPAQPMSSSATKSILEENEKDIKKKVEKLYQLASELKDDVEKTNSAQVLSLRLVKKAEEIEKLARDIKSRAKG
jgi:hypothetical protein